MSIGITSSEQDDACLQNVTIQNGSYVQGSERNALIEVSPRGFYLRGPPKPHQLRSFFTLESDLFQTIHMGLAIVDRNTWKLSIDGLVERPLTIDWDQLQRLPKTSIIAFHECYGSPIKPPDTNLWRIGNVTWSGVALDLILRLAKPKPEAQFLWSDGLENGSFLEAKDCDRYQKDLPLHKALPPGCLVAYEMNGAALEAKRGGPVRLIVPGFYGTNSTKWLCRLSLQASRSQSPFTTTYYNEVDPNDTNQRRMRPCWEVEPNSLLTLTPMTEGQIQGPSVAIEGYAWGSEVIEHVLISIRTVTTDWSHLVTIAVEKRSQYEWQHYHSVQTLLPGIYQLMAQAINSAGVSQPTAGRRNHVHIVTIDVI